MRFSVFSWDRFLAVQLGGSVDRHCYRSRRLDVRLKMYLNVHVHTNDVQWLSSYQEHGNPSQSFDNFDHYYFFGDNTVEHCRKQQERNGPYVKGWSRTHNDTIISLLRHQDVLKTIILSEPTYCIFHFQDLVTQTFTGSKAVWPTSCLFSQRDWNQMSLTDWPIPLTWMFILACAVSPVTKWNYWQPR